MKNKYIYKDIQVLPIWDQSQIEFRNHLIDLISKSLFQKMLEINRQWYFERIEGPLLLLADDIPEGYRDDAFRVDHEKANQSLYLRPETTKTSYAVAERIIQSGTKPPVCVWQSGKSFRTENNDGASASRLRFNEFYQLEFQCVVADNTKFEYLYFLPEFLSELLTNRFGVICNITDSDRLPHYSERTIDVEIEGREVASISKRLDFPKKNIIVYELAIGLDRLVKLLGVNNG